MQEDKGSIGTLVRSLCQSYQELCDSFLPVVIKDSQWRFNRQSEAGDAEQGWKLHVSATVLTANETLKKISSLLQSRGVLFKAPSSLHELNRINCGLFYGYGQIGKFITVYPRNNQEAVALARRLHKLTFGISAPAVPFDLQFQAGSSVYYRYGAFSPLEMENPDSTRVFAIKDPEGKLIPDLRDMAELPAWVSDPFILNRRQTKSPVGNSPLKTTFRAFKVLSRRGKGGVYQAIDFSVAPPRLCILKEGRAGGEVSWDGRDGNWRVRNEKYVLDRLRRADIAVPRVYSSFAVEGHYYLVTEFIEGNNLYALLSKRKRRLPIARAIRYGIQLSMLISRIHAAGWVWRDCKPANLIVITNGDLRPLDFEGACPIDYPDPVAWNTPEFAPPESMDEERIQSRAPEDLYALGAVIYFLITGRLPQSSAYLPMSKLRRGVPQAVCDIVSQLFAVDPAQRPSGQVVAQRLETVLSRKPSVTAKF